MDIQYLCTRAEKRLQSIIEVETYLNAAFRDRDMAALRVHVDNAAQQGLAHLDIVRRAVALLVEASQKGWRMDDSAKVGDNDAASSTITATGSTSSRMLQLWCAVMMSFAAVSAVQFYQTRGTVQLSNPYGSQLISELNKSDYMTAAIAAFASITAFRCLLNAICASRLPHCIHVFLSILEAPAVGALALLPFSTARRFNLPNGGFLIPDLWVAYLCVWFGTMALVSIRFSPSNRLLSSSSSSSSSSARSPLSYRIMCDVCFACASFVLGVLLYHNRSFGGIVFGSIALLTATAYDHLIPIALGQSLYVLSYLFAELHLRVDGHGLL